MNKWQAAEEPPWQLRAVTIDGPAVRINGRPVFQRLVLDQGFYPDGVFTAPSDDALRADVEESLRLARVR